MFQTFFPLSFVNILILVITATKSMQLILNKFTLFDITVYYISTLSTQLVILEITFSYYSIVCNLNSFTCDLTI